jgi:hypothetical protein
VVKAKILFFLYFKNKDMALCHKQNKTQNKTTKNTKLYETMVPHAHRLPAASISKVSRFAVHCMIDNNVTSQ